MPKNTISKKHMLDMKRLMNVLSNARLNLIYIAINLMN